MDILIYGASGYTGKLIAALAFSKGLKPILAGRSETNIKPLAEKYGFGFRIFNLDGANEVAKHLKGIRLVLNCAGPFSKTAKQMVEACLISGTHYLDITGEIEVFELLKLYDAKAREAGIVILPGVGFDVVPTDCAAKYLHDQLPDATHLELAFTSLGGGISQGTVLTLVENLGGSGAVRQNGKIIPKPTGHLSKVIDFGSKKRFCMSIPWGDISTAFSTTGIPNIITYTGVSQSTYRFMQWQWLFNPILRTKWVKKLANNYVRKNITGPTPEQNQQGKSLVWGRAENASGKSIEVRIETPEGYRLTSETALLIAQKVLSTESISGYQTPAGLFGSDLILEITGTKLY